MTYYAPTELDEALTLMAMQDVDIIAGCTDYFPSRPQAPFAKDLLDITRIGALNGISRTDAGWRIGAATRWSRIARADLPACFAGLQAAARDVGSLQIQNAGTIGGNLCNASPAADGVPPLLTLETTVEIHGPGGTRLLPLSDFLTGPRQTVLAPGELLVALHIPDLPAHTQGSFEKLGSRKYLVISISMVAAVIGCDAAGRIDFARIAVGACSAVAQRLTALETAVIGQLPGEIRITAEHLAPLAPISDVRASAEYRLDAAAEQILRAISKAAHQNG